MKGQNEPAVSVVIPTYDRAEKLARAMRSVFAQTLCAWEMIIVDDASSDGSEGLVRRLADERVRYVRHERNRGPSAARNSGVKAARGPYVAFLDSDDEWLPEKLAHDISAFEASAEDVGLIYSGETFFDREGKPVRIIPSIQGRAYEELLTHDFIGCCSRVIVRKNALEMVGGFDEQLVNEEDWDLWIRIAKVFKIGLVPHCLVKRHFGHDQVTGSAGSLRRIYEGRARIIGKHRERMPPRVLAKHLAVLAGLELNYDIAHGRKLAFEALGLRLVQPRLLAALAFSFVGVNSYRRVFSAMARLRHGLYMGRARI